MKFDEFNLSSEIKESIKKMGIVEPTKIQEDTIPLILDGKDVIGESATGSGKTLAFGAGIVEKVEHGKGIQALVLTPTRELAEQVKEVLNKLESKIRVTSIYGGVSIEPQMKNLRQTEVVVATPGRLLDHLERRTIDLSNIKMLILDEADTMLDMGFIDDVERIMKSCPRQKQILFFSATIRGPIQQLANRFMNSPQMVTAVKMVDPSKLEQSYYNLPRNQKLGLLVHQLKNEGRGLVMVFCNTRRTVDFVAKTLTKNNIRAIAIHGGFTQNKRSNTLDMFNDGKAGVLVCTDVAARGLHINNVSHVYNYDIPSTPKEYVHRIGRTARAGAKGQVINFLSEMDYDNFGRIHTEFREFDIKRGEVPEFGKISVAAVDSGRNNRRNFNSNRSRSRRRY